MSFLSGITHAASSVAQSVGHTAGSVGNKIVKEVKKDAPVVGGALKSFGKTALNETKKDGPSALKVAGVVAASSAGFAVGGPLGAAAAGGLASAGLSAADQEIRNGKVDWGQVAIDGAAGAIPGGGGLAGKAAVKLGERFGIQGVKRLATSQSAKAVLARSVSKGAVNGSLAGARYRFADTSYLDWKNNGNIDPAHSFQDAARGAFAGAIGGGFAGGLTGRAAQSTPAEEGAPIPVDVVSQASGGFFKSLLNHELDQHRILDLQA